MNAKPEARSSSSRWPEAVAIVLSLVAVGVSGFSLVEAQRQHQDERATQLLDQIYDDWDQMAAPERWEVSHLDEVPATYDHVRDVLRAYSTRLPVQEQRRVYLLERTTAIRILNAFELTLNQRRRAIEIGDSGRKAMLDQEIDFYVEDLLRNPRLLWFWSAEGGGLELLLDPPTVAFYRRRVLHDPAHPLIIEPDPDGILPGFDGID
jgi:hypothetical protein